MMVKSCEFTASRYGVAPGPRRRKPSLPDTAVLCAVMVKFFSCSPAWNSRIGGVIVTAEGCCGFCVYISTVSGWMQVGTVGH